MAPLGPFSAHRPVLIILSGPSMTANRPWNAGTLHGLDEDAFDLEFLTQNLGASQNTRMSSIFFTSRVQEDPRSMATVGHQVFCHCWPNQFVHRLKATGVDAEIPGFHSSLSAKCPRPCPCLLTPFSCIAMLP